MKEWLWYEDRQGDPFWNMAVDHVLLQKSGPVGQPLIRFYTWNGPAATFGYFQKWVDVSQQTDLRPLIRRPTGGGIVDHRRDLTYSVIVPPHHSWYKKTARQSYCDIHQSVAEALDSSSLKVSLAAEPKGPDLGECFLKAEISDVIAGSKKVAGAAQRRTREGLLIQGSIQVPRPSPLETKKIPQAFLTSLTRREKASLCATPWEFTFSAEATKMAETIYRSDEYNQRR